MDIKQLSSSDFPGIDEAKFSEWKSLRIKADRDVNIAFVLGCIAGVLSPLINPDRLGLAALAVFVMAEFVIYRATHKRLRRLAGELRMSDRLKALERGAPKAAEL
jgi:hypothetical protein